jgi:CheY-like chemotaxis protein
MSAPTNPRDEACVLIVDDEEEARETLRDVVELTGCATILAASGADALAAIATRRPCLVIADLLMPGMTGAQMLEKIRMQPALATLPVIISTSAPERAPRGVPVLAKPIDVQALFNWIGRSCHCHA